jgi:uncharacterized membrane protein (DUF441 family)
METIIIKENQMKDLVPSLIRTYVPVIVGQFVAWLALKGVNLDDKTVVSLTATVGGIITAVYYLAARLLERYVSPKLGWLLGRATPPVYQEGK